MARDSMRRSSEADTCVPLAATAVWVERTSLQNSCRTCLVKGTVELARSYQRFWGRKGIGRRSLDFFSEREDLAPAIISSNLPHDSVSRGDMDMEIGIVFYLDG